MQPETFTLLDMLLGLLIAVALMFLLQTGLHALAHRNQRKPEGRA